MPQRNGSILARCTRLLPRTKRSEQSKKTSTAQAWPRTTKANEFCIRALDDDCAPLLEKCTSSKVTEGRSTQLEENVRSSPLSMPSRCHLPSVKHFTTLLSTVILALIFLSSTTLAAPLPQQRSQPLIGRQSIPDRFGNTGTEIDPGGLPESAPEVEASAAPSTLTQVVTSTIRVLPSTAATSIQIIPTTVASASRIEPSSPPSIIPVTSAVPTNLASVLTTVPTAVSPLTSASSISPAQIPESSSTFVPTTSSTAEALLRIAPINPLAPAILAGIITGGVVLLASLIGLLIFLYRRRRAQEIEEIPIRRSKLGSRLANRVFGGHYDDRIARSRSRNGSQDDGVTIFTKRRPSSGSLKKDMTLKLPQQTYGGKSQGAISPSVYSPRMTMRMTRISTMTFGSVSGWLDKTTIGKPMPVPAFTGTPSQLLDAPKPLFAKPMNTADDAWVEKPAISAPRPTRPGSAEPLGGLSGMGFGLGSGTNK